jgi:pSer/pThr/pTyr-binding forkhead associated (FHA) protein
MPRLVFLGDNFSGQSYEFVIERTTVGRAENNILVIHDDSVSGHHCEVLVNGSEVIVRDLDSRNGTFVDGVRLNKQSQAKSGQLVRFGSVTARLEIEAGLTQTDGTEITAVYDLRQIMRDKRREAKKPHPANPSQHVDPHGPGAGEAERTIIMPRTRPAQPPAGSVASKETEAIPAPKSRAWLWGLLAAGLLVAALLIWLAMRGG